MRPQGEQAMKRTLSIASWFKVLFKVWFKASPLVLALVLTATAPTAKAQAQTITVAGTGSSMPLVQLLFTEYQKQAPEVSLHLVQPPLGTNGALKALRAKRVDVVIVGRPITPAELNQLGQHFDLAYTPFVMASSDGLRRGGFSLDELAKVYEGSLAFWDKGAPIRLILRGSFESDTLLLKEMSPRMAQATVAANKRPGMAGAVNDIETAKLIASTPGSLGPTTLGLLRTMGLNLKLFPINGAAPTISNLKSGRYPWHKKLSVVLPHTPDPAVAAFAKFLRSPRAQELMLQYDYIPIAQ